MTPELQIGGHGFDLGLSQSREADSGQTADRLPSQQASRIKTGSGMRGSRILTPPNQKSACTSKELQTLVGHKHTSKASDITSCCCMQCVGQCLLVCSQVPALSLLGRKVVVSFAPSDVS